MESRFSAKDFVFVLLFLLVGAMVAWSAYQNSYQGDRLNALKEEVRRLADEIKGGGRVATTTAVETEPRGAARIRQKNADGSQYVCYPDIPASPRDPTKLPDYALGDWLVKNIGGEPTLLTPFITKDMQGQLVQGPVLESLVAQNPETMEYEPFLADKYWISADGLRFKFHLRPQACFSDGVPMTADDVVFSYNTIMNADVDCAPLRGYYDRVKSCTKIDDRTVEFAMTEPYFLAMDFVGGMSIIPAHVYKFKTGEEYNKKVDVLVGSGPYRLDKWERGQKITLVRNDRYWGDPATCDRLVFMFIGNAQAQMTSFLQGELDELSEPIEPEAEQYLRYANDPDFQKNFIAYKFARANAMHMYIGWNLEKPMFKDKATRQALTMLIDRKGMIDEMLQGFGVEMTGPFIPMSLQNDKTVKPLPFDPEAARKKLAEAGWKAGSDGVLVRDGVRFEFDMSLRTGVPIRERMATRVQQELKAAGIRMRLTPYEASVLIERLDEHKYDACLAGWGGGGVESDPMQIWHSSSIADKGSNHVSFRNAEADKLIEEGRRTLDEAKRMDIWHKFQQLVYDEQPYTWMYAEVDCAFINGRFKNTKPYPTGLGELDWYVPRGAQKYK